MNDPVVHCAATDDSRVQLDAGVSDFCVSQYCDELLHREADDVTDSANEVDRSLEVLLERYEDRNIPVSSRLPGVKFQGLQLCIKLDRNLPKSALCPGKIFPSFSPREYTFECMLATENFQKCSC